MVIPLKGTTVREISPQKPDENDSSKDKASQDEMSIEELCLNVCSEESKSGVGDMNSVVAETDVEFSLNENVDWSLTGIMNHPSGVDFALKENLDLMEQQTKELIENGSVEDLLKALEENTRQLEMLKNRMESSIGGWLANNN